MSDHDEPPAVRGEWDDLKNFGKHLGGVSGVISTIVAAIPAAAMTWWDILAQVAPPFATAFVALASGTSALWMMRLFFKHRKTPSTGFDRSRTYHLITAMIAAVVYLALYFAMTGQVQGHRYVRGLSIKSEALQTTSREPHVDTLLQNNGYTDEQQNNVWAHRWAVKAILFVFFYLTLAATTGYFALWVLEGMAKDREAGR